MTVIFSHHQMWTRHLMPCTLWFFALYSRKTCPYGKGGSTHSYAHHISCSCATLCFRGVCFVDVSVSTVYIINVIFGQGVYFCWFHSSSPSYSRTHICHKIQQQMCIHLVKVNTNFGCACYHAHFPALGAIITKSSKKTIIIYRSDCTF
jgi:hypothetical protein